MNKGLLLARQVDCDLHQGADTEFRAVDPAGYFGRGQRSTALANFGNRAGFGSEAKSPSLEGSGGDGRGAEPELALRLGVADREDTVRPLSDHLQSDSLPVRGWHFAQAALRESLQQIKGITTPAQAALNRRGCLKNGRIGLNGPHNLDLH